MDTVKDISSEGQEEQRHPLGDSNVPRIFFANWKKESRTAYLRAARKNMEELQDDYDRINTRTNTFMIVNGTVLGLVLAFMVNSNLLITPELMPAGWLMVIGFGFLTISFITVVWASTGTKEAPVMNFWVGADADAWSVIDDPDDLTEDLINGFLMRCDDVRQTVERAVDRIQLCGRIFSTGLVILMISVVYALLVPVF